MGRAEFTILRDRSNTGHSVYQKDAEFWLDESERMIWGGWDVYSMDGMEMNDLKNTERQWWVQIMVLQYFTNMFTKRRFTTILQ